MKRLISLLLCVVMIVGIVPTVASAAELPFTDVKKGSWYYASVKWCYENGYLSGTSNTTFEPQTAVSRAMAVTVLWRIEGAPSVKSGNPFRDVSSGQWFAKAVVWAAKNGIAAGMSADTFAPDAPVTREQLAVFFYKYAIYKQTTEGAFVDLKMFKDGSSVSKWAQPAVSWCVSLGIISGKDGGRLAPKDGATRAELAAMLKKFIEKVVNAVPEEHIHEWGKPVITKNPTIAGSGVETETCAVCSETRSKTLPRLTFKINGSDLSRYTVIYPAAADTDSRLDWLKHSAKRLAEFINAAFAATYDTGDPSIPDDYPVPRIGVASDAAEPTDHEILVGRTNREDAGLVTVSFDEGASDVSYSISVQGSRLVIAGYADAAKLRGSRYGVYDFCEDALGYHFYNDDTIVRDPVSANIGADYTLVGGPAFKDRVVYWTHGWNDVYCNDEYYNTCNMVHGGLECIKKNGGIVKNGEACLTEEDNIKMVIEAAAERLRSHPKDTCIWISQEDSATAFCTCENCRAEYRKYGTRGATIYALCNRAARELKEEFPYVHIKTLAYDFGVAPPMGMEMEDNVIVYYCPITGCASHAYSDTSCTLNKTVCEQVTGWSQLCDEFYLWDYSADFSYGLAPFPNLFVIRDNTRWFYEMGARGVFNNAVTGPVADLEPVRSFLLTRLYRDPMMSAERYEELMDGFLAAYYGPGWQGIREYFDIIEECSEGQHFGFTRPVSVMYDLNAVADQADHINALWDRAEELAENDTQYNNIRSNRISTTYLVQTAIFDREVTNGDDASREAYYAINDQLFEDIKTYDVRIDEKDTKVGEMHFNRETAPESWVS